MVTEQGDKISEAARNLGIHAGVLSRWIKGRSPESSRTPESNVKLQPELKRVKRENERLRMEREILKKAAAFFGASFLATCQRVSIRFHFIDRVKKAYPLYLVCKVMQVSRSGYYSWKKRGESSRDQERAKLISKVKTIHKASRGTYGSRRMAQELEAATGIPCGKHKAGTLMKLAGVKAQQRRKFKATTNSKHDLPIAPNILTMSGLAI